MIELNAVVASGGAPAGGGPPPPARAADWPITQPALHQQVKKLEAELGVQLLERLGKDRMQATPAGAHLLAFVDPFLRGLPAVTRSLRTGEFDGALSIHAESLPIRLLLPDWLHRLRRKRPNGRVHLREVAVPDLDALRTGAADVLVAHLPELPDDVAAERIGTLHPLVVMPRERAAGDRPPPLRELADLPFVAYPVHSRQYALQLQALALHDVPPPQTLHVDTADTILGFVEAGLGWSLVPSLTPDGPGGRRLAAFPLQRPRTTFPLHVAWRKDAPEHPLLDALLACAPRPGR
jgi:DNA-binding transcriptional LysR family regulator